MVAISGWAVVVICMYSTVVICTNVIYSKLVLRIDAKNVRDQIAIIRGKQKEKLE